MESSQVLELFHHFLHYHLNWLSLANMTSLHDNEWLPSPGTTYQSSVDCEGDIIDPYSIILRSSDSVDHSHLTPIPYTKTAYEPTETTTTTTPPRKKCGSCGNTPELSSSSERQKAPPRTEGSLSVTIIEALTPPATEEPSLSFEEADKPNKKDDDSVEAEEKEDDSAENTNTNTIPIVSPQPYFFQFKPNLTSPQPEPAHTIPRSGIIWTMNSLASESSYTDADINEKTNNRNFPRRATTVQSRKGSVTTRDKLRRSSIAMLEGANEALHSLFQRPKNKA